MKTNVKKNYSVPVALVSLLSEADVLTASDQGESVFDIKVPALQEWFNN